ncbi:GNAT family N-acetyltransferase [Nereida ignava]|uniref:L-ornithine N(alpha)-acyltransferase n=1 Tax=Nereida ignava TaxID=282199 RepID=A0A0U1NH91_9RHOB|nr:GNAT family N-acetyltransferase [Nereida ignava]CRK74084.1 hypothetical protein NIG5292_00109 [Nereida ignava]SFJ28684.1 ornithine-acyl[acyl carrier protein] N-acyltransferase [Nereida ignava DSM 16309]
MQPRDASFDEPLSPAPPTRSAPRFIARPASGPAELHALQALRHRAFFGSAGIDADPFDALSQHHVVVDHQQDGRIVGGFRTRVLQPVTTPQGAASYADSYTGGFYDLRPFAERGDTVLELGRVCVDPNVQNADVLRRAWGALAQLVRVADVDVIIGCSSFEGTEIARHTDVLCHLFAKHGRQGHGTPVLLDGQAGEIAGGKAVALASLTPTGQVLRPTDVPPLLRTYLLMGGWIGDHAVIDPHMKTTHVFTALRVADVPEARKRLADSWA